MKNSLSLFTALFLFLISSVNTNSQWQPDVLLSGTLDSSFSANNNSKSIAVNGNVIHVAWLARPGGGGYIQIFYKRSTDNGLTWSSEVQISNDTWYYTLFPNIAVSGNDVHICWIHNHLPDYHPLYKHSTDGGLTWSSLAQISNYDNYFPSISASVSNVFYVNEQVVGINQTKILYSRSTNGGMSWLEDYVLTNNSTYQYNPSVCIGGSQVHIVWYDFRDGNNEIYYKRSSDLGATWGPDIRMTNDPSSSIDPSIASSGNSLHVVWRDLRDGNYEIYYKRSIDAGLTWGSDIRLTNNPDSSANPSVEASGLNVHVVWQDNRDGNWEIYYKNSTDGGTNWSADTRLTNAPNISQLPSISVSGSIVHVLWSDSRNGKSQLFYKRNPTGNPEGIVNINSEIPKSFSLSQNYPNPFNPSTKIRFEVPLTKGDLGGFVKLSVYDVLGREVATLVNESLKPGSYEVDWNASNFPSGVYYYKLVVGDPSASSGQGFVETKKMILIK